MLCRKQATVEPKATVFNSIDTCSEIWESDPKRFHLNTILMRGWRRKEALEQSSVAAKKAR
jgi:hypothetical protein